MCIRELIDGFSLKTSAKAAAFCVAVSLGATATAQTLASLPETPAADVVTPVLYAYTTLGQQRSESPVCWQVLVPQSQITLREHEAKPFLLRNMVPIVGAIAGGITGGLLLKQHAFSSLIARRWAIPVVAAGAGAGYVLGPGGVAGFVLGGAIGEKVGKRKLPITLAAAAGGALAGKGIWQMLFPPEVGQAAGGGPDDDIPEEIFVREQMCGRTVQTAYSQAVYRVGYRFNGQEYNVDLPYDPGDALILTANGNIAGPARIRTD